jgi:hypothetical protein
MKTFLATLAALAFGLSVAHANPGDYANNSAVYQQYIRECGRITQHFSSDNKQRQAAEDKAAKKIEAMNPDERALKIEGCRRFAAHPAPRPEPAPAVQPVRYRPDTQQRSQQHFDTFENVAKKSREVTTSGGDHYDLRSLSGPTKCDAPRHWHRTDQCSPLDDGGVSCRMECR